MSTPFSLELKNIKPMQRTKIIETIKHTNKEVKISGRAETNPEHGKYNLVDIPDITVVTQTVI